MSRWSRHLHNSGSPQCRWMNSSWKPRIFHPPSSNHHNPLFPSCTHFLLLDGQFAGLAEPKRWESASIPSGILSPSNLGCVIGETLQSALPNGFLWILRGFIRNGGSLPVPHAIAPVRHVSRAGHLRTSHTSECPFIVLLFPSERSLSDKMYSLSDEICTLSMKTGWME